MTSEPSFLAHIFPPLKHSYRRSKFFFPWASWTVNATVLCTSSWRLLSSITKVPIYITMARLAPLRFTKATIASRRNLQHLGIPDGRDVLAIYLLWRKQRSLRAPSSLSSTMRCEVDHDEIDRSESELPATVLCSSIVRVDLLHVGAQFEGCGGALLGVGV